MYNPSLKILEVCEKLEGSAGIYLTTNAWKLTDYSKKFYSCFCFYYSLFYASAFDGNTRWEGHLIPLQYLLSSVLELWWEWQFKYYQNASKASKCHAKVPIATTNKMQYPVGFFFAAAAASTLFTHIELVHWDCQDPSHLAAPQPGGSQFSNQCIDHLPRLSHIGFSSMSLWEFWKPCRNVLKSWEKSR